MPKLFSKEDLEKKAFEIEEQLDKYYSDESIRATEGYAYVYNLMFLDEIKDGLKQYSDENEIKAHLKHLLDKRHNELKDIYPDKGQVEDVVSLFYADIAGYISPELEQSHSAQGPSLPLIKSTKQDSYAEALLKRPVEAQQKFLERIGRDSPNLLFDAVVSSDSSIDSQRSLTDLLDFVPSISTEEAIKIILAKNKEGKRLHHMVDELADKTGNEALKENFNKALSIVEFKMEFEGYNHENNQEITELLNITRELLIKDPDEVIEYEYIDSDEESDEEYEDDTTEITLDDVLNDMKDLDIKAQAAIWKRRDEDGLNLLMHFIKNSPENIPKVLSFFKTFPHEDVIYIFIQEDNAETSVFNMVTDADEIQAKVFFKLLEFIHAFPEDQRVRLKETIQDIPEGIWCHNLKESASVPLNGKAFLATLKLIDAMNIEHQEAIWKAVDPMWLMVKNGYSHILPEAMQYASQCNPSDIVKMLFNKHDDGLSTFQHFIKQSHGSSRLSTMLLTLSERMPTEEFFNELTFIESNFWYYNLNNAIHDNKEVIPLFLNLISKLDENEQVNIFSSRDVIGRNPLIACVVHDVSYLPLFLEKIQNLPADKIADILSQKTRLSASIYISVMDDLISSGKSNALFDVFQLIDSLDDEGARNRVLNSITTAQWLTCFQRAVGIEPNSYHEHSLEVMLKQASELAYQHPQQALKTMRYIHELGAEDTRFLLDNGFLKEIEAAPERSEYNLFFRDNKQAWEAQEHLQENIEKLQALTNAQEHAPQFPKNIVEFVTTIPQSEANEISSQLVSKDGNKPSILERVIQSDEATLEDVLTLIDFIKPHSLGEDISNKINLDDKIYHWDRYFKQIFNNNDTNALDSILNLVPDAKQENVLSRVLVLCAYYNENSLPTLLEKVKTLSPDKMNSVLTKECHFEGVNRSFIDMMDPNVDPKNASRLKFFEFINNPENKDLREPLVKTFNYSHWRAFFKDSLKNVMNEDINEKQSLMLKQAAAYAVYQPRDAARLEAYLHQLDDEEKKQFLDKGKLDITKSTPERRALNQFMSRAKEAWDTQTRLITHIEKLSDLTKGSDLNNSVQALLKQSKPRGEMTKERLENITEQSRAISRSNAPILKKRPSIGRILVDIMKVATLLVGLISGVGTYHSYQYTQKNKGLFFTSAAKKQAHKVEEDLEEIRTFDKEDNQASRSKKP